MPAEPARLVGKVCDLGVELLGAGQLPLDRPPGAQCGERADVLQQNLLLRDDGNGSQGTPQRKRPHVTHEYLGGVSVEPQKPETGACQRRTEYEYLARTRDIRNAEVFGEVGVARHVGEYAEGAGNEQAAADVQGSRHVHQECSLDLALGALEPAHVGAVVGSRLVGTLGRSQGRPVADEHRQQIEDGLGFG